MANNRKFGQKYKMWPKIQNLAKHTNFYRKYNFDQEYKKTKEFLLKNQNCGEQLKLKFYKILVNTLNFGQNFKFWSKL